MAGDEVELLRLEHGGPVRAIAFDPDRQWLVSASEDGTVRRWYLDFPDSFFPTDEETFYDREFSVYQFQFKWPDRKDRWLEMDDDDLIRAACQRLPRNLTQEEWNSFLVGEVYRPVCPDILVPDR